MSCGCDLKDQTPQEVFDHLESKGTQRDDNLKGIGMFLLPDPEAGAMEYKVVLVAGLSYGEATKRGMTCEAFKWIPDDFKSLKEIEAMRRNCRRIWCGPQRRWCPWYCFCPWYSHNCA